MRMLRAFTLGEWRLNSRREGRACMSTATVASPAGKIAAKLGARPLLVRRAAVLGAGTMGSRIAAHLANAGIPVLLLDIVPDNAKSKSELAVRALEALAKS